MKAIPLNLAPTLAVRRQVLTNLGILTVISILTVWLYMPTRTFEFVNWDDPWYILKNPLIQSWSLANLKGILTETVARNYAPLTIFSFLLDHTLWGDWAGGFHLTNLLLHAANAVLVFLLIRQVTGRTDWSAVTAVLFAAHPVQVETVAWVSSRKGLLSGTFILASLLFWLREDRKARHEGWGILLLALALLCKAIAVVVPAIVLAYDLIVRRQKFAEAIVRQIIPGFLAVWLLLATMAAQVTELGGVRDHLGLSRFDIFAVDLVILWRYVGMLLYPHDLCVLYDPATTGIGALALIAGIAWSGIGWWLWAKRDRQPLVLFAAVCWIVLLIPVLNLFPITTLMNDRYLYLPSIPAMALLVASLGVVIGHVGHLSSPRYSRVMGGVLMLLVAGSFVKATRDYLPVWRNDLALWEYAVQEAPQLPVVQIQRAISLKNAGQTAAAINALDYALTHCEPDPIDRQRIEEKLVEYRGQLKSP